MTHSYPDAFKWLCARCQTWNDIEKGKCKCGALAADHASAYRLRTKLSPEEQGFYAGTAPMILRELSGIKLLLKEIVELIRKE